MIFKFWLWIIELRIRYARDDKKILVLAKMMCDELKNQGHDINATCGSGGPYFSVSQHENSLLVYGHKFSLQIMNDQ